MTEQPLTHPPLVVGLLRPSDPRDDGLRLREQCKAIVSQGYNFVLLPLNRKPSPEAGGALDMAAYRALPPPSFTRQAHKALGSAQWRSVLGVVELPGPALDGELLAHICGEAVQWTRYLGLHGLMLPLPGGGNGGEADDRLLQDYAAIIAGILQQTRLERFDIWFRLSPRQADWQAWNALRAAVGVIPGSQLHVVLDFDGLDAREADWSLPYRRWFGESLRALLLPTALFGDEQGHPVLPARLQALVQAFMRYPELSWIVAGPCLHEQGYAAYRTHIAALQARLPLSFEEVYMRPSVDQLQRPLQPLDEHLSSTTYEDFEQDPVKYLQYEKAIRLAINERHTASESLTLMVLGAGRGPLVDAAARASHGFRGRLKLFVIEKNPSAAVTLRHRARDDWGDLDVAVIESDMREWETAERADILVSELLGSWGDNELSPECLDGAQRLLKPDGISIPAAYTSWLSPIASAKLHAAVASRVPPGYPRLSAREHFETTYVVRMGAVCQLAPEQPCFRFEHPNRALASNARQATCHFTLPAELERCTVHGFRGTFDCQLYGDIAISIADATRSEGMWSWSPLFIPLETPLTLPGGSPLEVRLWRKVGPQSVWYEWLVKGHSPLHNPGGRSASIGLA